MASTGWTNDSKETKDCFSCLQAEEFDGSTNPIVAFKGIKIGDFNGIFIRDL
jgi:hypothetical protein